MKSPFRIPTWIYRGLSSMRIFELIFVLQIALKLFLHVVHDPDLEVAPRRIINGCIPFIELLASDCKVIFHQIEKTVVMVGIDPGIFDDY